MNLEPATVVDSPDTRRSLLGYLKTPAVLAHLSSGEVRLLLPSPESGVEEEQVASAAVAELIRTCHQNQQGFATIPVEVSGLESTPLGGREAEYVRLSDEYGLLIMSSTRRSGGFLSRLRQLAARLPVGVLIKEAEGEFRYLYWNERMERIYDLTSEEVVGKGDRELFEPEIAELARREDEETVRRGGRPLFGRARPAGKNNRNRYAQHAKFLIEDEERSLIVSFVTDVTRLMESRRALTAANSWKNLMLSVVSHDVLAPLQAMAQAIEDLARRHNEMDPESREQALSFLRAGSEKTASLLEDVLLWSSSEDGVLGGEPELIEATELVRQVALRAGVIFGITVELAVPPSAVVHGSRPALQTILRNLVSNACEHGGGGPVRCSIAAEEGRTVFTVADSGPGMPESYLGSLNDGVLPEELQSGNHGRRGIGLQLCLSLAARVGGRLSFELPEGGGTVARLEVSA
ncbi:MAG: ATP-binding protein [Spirochaetaceae bacterium]